MTNSDSLCEGLAALVAERTRPVISYRGLPRHSRGVVMLVLRPADPRRPLVLGKTRTWLTGGLSNWLFHVSLPTDARPRASEPQQVLLRLYGQTHGERALEGLVTESVIFTLLSERRLGPKLHGVFPGGRIEEFIAARPLVTSELSHPVLSQIIAQKTAQIHAMNIPISKEPNWLWNTMSGWLENVEANLEDPSTVTLDNEIMVKRLKSYNIKEEVDWLRRFLAKIPSRVVFCHNDLQEGNILLCSEDERLTDNPELVLIDFEYCSYNYRGFDLANHFVEWMYDYTKAESPQFTVDRSRYPTRQQQLEFVKTYLSAGRKEKQGPVTPEEEEALLREVRAFTLASHLFWGLWSAVNAKLSEIPFGYWEYAIERLESYFSLKREILSSNSDILAAALHSIADTSLKRKIKDVEG